VVWNLDFPGIRPLFAKVEVLSARRDVAGGKPVTADPQWEILAIWRNSHASLVPWARESVVDNPQNVTPESSWKPVPYRGGRCPAEGVGVTAVSSEETWITTLATAPASYSCDEMLRPFGEPPESQSGRTLRKPRGFWDLGSAGFVGRRFSWALEHLARWQEARRTCAVG